MPTLITGSMIVKAVNPSIVINQHLLSLNVKGVAVDSRKIDGDNFAFAAVTLSRHSGNTSKWYAISSERSGDYFFDHHDYIYQAIERGACIILCERFPEEINEDVLYIQVNNVIASLGKLAAYIIHATNTKVIAVTGSSGKTTTVHTIYLLLRTQLSNVVKVYTYRPNPISLPLEILNLYCMVLERNGILIVEMPTDHHGCISALSEIARPDISVVLNVLDAHIKVFGSQDEIARAKSEIIDAQRNNGDTVLNFDDMRVRAMLEKTKQRRVISFAVENNASVKGIVKEIKSISTVFEVAHGGKSMEVEMPLIGFSSIYIVLAAASVGIAYGLTLEQIKEGLESFKPMQGRMSWIMCNGGRVIIFDNSEKTNTTNLHHLLGEVMKLPWDGKKIFVLGPFDYHEHAKLSNEIWTRVCSFFDHIVLVLDQTVQDAQQFLNNPLFARKIQIAPTLDDAVGKVIQLTTNVKDRTCYLLMVGRHLEKFDEVVRSVVEYFKSKEDTPL